MFWNRPRPENHPLGVKKTKNLLIQEFFNHDKWSNIYKWEVYIL